MQVSLLVLGVVLGFFGSLFVQARERRFQFRTTVFLQRLPPLERTARRFHDVAAQDPKSGPLWYLSDNDWLFASDTDDLYRDSVIAGRVEARMAGRVRQCWKAMADQMDPDWGKPTDLVLGDKQFRDAAAAAQAAIGDYQLWLERRFTRWRRLPTSK